jgi:hypothetical protein
MELGRLERVLEWIECRYLGDRLHRMALNEGVADGSRVSRSPRPAMAKGMTLGLGAAEMRSGDAPMCWLGLGRAHPRSRGLDWVRRQGRVEEGP